NKVAWLESLVQADNSPLCLSSHFFVHESHGEIYETFDSGSLHQFLNKTYGIKVKRKSSTITALLPSREDAAMLRTAINQPILRIRSLNVDTGSGKPVEYVVTRFRADRVDMTIEY